jgi:Zn ribbon nucleic-acid-binding protein
MASHQYWDECPHCHNDSLERYEEKGLYNNMSGFCIACGYKYSTEEGQANLQEVNEYRTESGRKPLKRLKKKQTQ